jgi:copper chaperone CopZ
LKQVQKAKASTIFSLHNLGCSSCLATIELKLKRLPGIESVDVNHIADTISVNFNPAEIAEDDIRDYETSHGLRSKDGR